MPEFHLPDPQTCEEIDPRQVAELAPAIAAGKITLVDCRDQDEWDQAHLPGARHIPLDEFDTRAAPLLESSIPCLVYCHHGMRSLRATRWLRAHGARAAFSMTGGIDRWSLEIDPSLPRY